MNKQRHYKGGGGGVKLLDMLGDRSLAMLKQAGHDPEDLRKKHAENKKQARRKKAVRIRISILQKRMTNMTEKQIKPLKQYCYISRDAAGRVIIRPFSAYRKHFEEYLIKNISIT